jgi:NAD(P)H-nitrite reductase large subunit
MRGGWTGSGFYICNSTLQHKTNGDNFLAIRQFVSDAPEQEDEKSIRIKQLNRIVCICNGIRLAAVLRALEDSETVADVNRKAGTGSGGCKGERCGPRIKTLLRKQRELESDTVGQSPGNSSDEPE